MKRGGERTDVLLVTQMKKINTVSYKTNKDGDTRDNTSKKRIKEITDGILGDGSAFPSTVRLLNEAMAGIQIASSHVQTRSIDDK
ncbi:hypothetical protein TNCV_3854921 [Trichonephila clavipes]|nr:hypothetical protein TNCV_3854921 [Trichonephila clavipes]